MLALVVVAYNQAESLERLAAAARAARGTSALHLFLHSDHPETVATCERLAAESDVSYHPHRRNRGVAASWNDGVLAAYGDGADFVVVANDDVVPAAGDLDRVADRAERFRDRYIVSCAGPHEGLGERLPSHGYSFFALNPVALETIGCFDENFFPVYGEDQDYARRAALAGLSEANCADTEVVHRGSAAIRTSADLARQNAVTQALNIAYYVRKWGGDAGSERFSTPFGRTDVGLRIDPSDRAAPYGPGLDRADRSVVAV